MLTHVLLRPNLILGPLDFSLIPLKRLAFHLEMDALKILIGKIGNITVSLQKTHQQQLENYQAWPKELKNLRMLFPLTLRQTFQRYRKRSKRLMTNTLRWVKSWTLRKMSLKLAESSLLKKFTQAQRSPKPITLSWRNTLLPKKLSCLVSKRNLLETLMHSRERFFKCHSWKIAFTLRQSTKNKPNIRSSSARLI